MQDSNKLMLLGLGVKLFAEGWGNASLESSLAEPPGSFKQIDAQQKAQSLKILGLVGDGFFWFGAYKAKPKLTIAVGVAATALVYAPKLIKRFDPKGWEEAGHPRVGLSEAEFRSQFKHHDSCSHHHDPESRRQCQEAYAAMFATSGSWAHDENGNVYRVSDDGSFTSEHPEMSYADGDYFAGAYGTSPVPTNFRPARGTLHRRTRENSTHHRPAW